MIEDAMRYFSEVPVVVEKKPLYDIWLEMEESQERWYQQAFDLFGVPFVTECFMPPVTFMLAYCIAQARGLMASGNWLRLPLSYHVGHDLADDQILFTGPIPAHGWALLSGSEPMPSLRFNEEAVLGKKHEIPTLPPVS